MRRQLFTEVNAWQAQFDLRTLTIRQQGIRSMAIPQGYAVTLTFTETVVRDAALLKKVFAGLKNDAPDASLSFMGVLRGHNW